MRPTSVARWGSRLCAASGRGSKDGFTAVVEKLRQRQRRKFFGYHKAARRDNPEVVGSNPASRAKSKTTDEGGLFIFELVLCR